MVTCVRLLAFAILTVTLSACERNRVRPQATSSNPVAVCVDQTRPEREAEADCLSLTLSAPLTITVPGGRAEGTVTVFNRCDTPVAFITEPIDTRVRSSEVWDKSRASVYARLTIYEVPTDPAGLDDVGYPVHSLPTLGVVAPHSEVRLPFEDGSDRLSGLQPDRRYVARFCTLAASVPEGWSTDSNRLSLAQSIELREKSVRRPCDVRLRDAARMVCSPDVEVKVIGDGHRLH